MTGMTARIWSSISSLLVALLAWTTLVNVVVVVAYIPAVAVNDTSSIINSDDSIHIAWLPNGIYTAKLSRQLIADPVDNTSTAAQIIPWTKYSKGVLVHFSESSLSQQAPSNVPWIAMINCDSNGTDFSMEWDIFTLARDHGAQAALLYTVNSEGCLMNQHYLQDFEKPLDVYATRDKQSARLIENQFTLNVGKSAYQFDSLTLNNSASSIKQLLDSDSLFIVGDIVVSSISGAVSTVSSNTGYDFSTDGGDDGGGSYTRHGGPRVTVTDQGPQATGTDDGSDDAGSGNYTDPTSALYTDMSSGSRARRSRRRFNIDGAGQQLQPRQATSTTTTSSRTTSSSSTAATQTIMAASYLGAVMASTNMTVGPDAKNGTSATSTSTSTSSGSGGGGPNTGLAMIILYAITGVVTFMFLVVILSGAVRAIRHPERYGPRGGRGANLNNHGGLGGAGGGGGGGQTRAAGLTRAILDTFPVVKFGRSGGEEEGDEGRRTKVVEDEEEGRAVELSRIEALHGVPVVAVGREVGGDGDRGDDGDVGGERVGEKEVRHQPSRETVNRRSTSSDSSSFRSALSSPLTAVSPTGVTPPPPPIPPLPSATSPPQETTTTINPIDVNSSTTCPICVCDFELGEDVRILPCDGRHRFHRDCIDPWLLEVSSLCPLCRLDLAKGREMERRSEEGSGEGAVGDEEANEQMVISNLRAMLQGRNSVLQQQQGGSGSGSGSGSVGAAGGIGSVGGAVTNTRNRFFRYVASRRQLRSTARAAAEGGRARSSTILTSTSGGGGGGGGGRRGSTNTRETRGLSFSLSNQEQQLQGERDRDRERGENINPLP
ncbi:hypothetical protein T439DRAFT_380759 [Meredithblackwellia eburnea MCA 4105]